MSKKNCARTKCPRLKWIKTNCDMKPTLISQMNSWLLNAILNRYCYFPKMPILCHFSLNVIQSSYHDVHIDLDESNSIGEKKWHNLCLDFSWKIAISPDCNIHIEWNKRYSQAKCSFVILIYVSWRSYFLFTSNEGTFSLHNVFLDTLYIKINLFWF